MLKYIKMNKVYRKTRNVAIMLATFLFSVSVFASVISDNDGSVFITKKVFEDMKKDFADQITNYNNSIDTKIDGAISAYLAGIRLDEEYKLDPCKSMIEYPLTFRMRNGVLDWSKWGTNGATPYWSPNYTAFFWGRRASCNYLIDRTFPVDCITRSFYNGTWDGKAFKIKNMINNVEGDLDVKTIFYNYILEYSNEEQVWFGFTMDQTDVPARTSRGTNTITRSYIRSSGNLLVDFYSGSTDYTIVVDAIWSWGGTGPLTITSSSNNNEHYINQFKASRDGWSEGNNPKSYTYASSLKYDTGNINFIMNQYDSDRTNANGKRIELPVAYDGHIYLTNKNNFKKDLMSGSSNYDTNYWNGYYVRNSSKPATQYRTVWKFGNMISPGWTLEPQFSGYNNSSDGQPRKVYEKSLMEPQDMYYEVTTPVTNKVLNQTLTNGVLLTEADKNLEYLKVTFKLQSEEDATKKYLVFSKAPITQSDYTQIDTEAAANDKKYFKISKKKDMTDSVYKYELSEGTNTIYINNIQKKDLVYYKILWDKSNTSYAKLTEEPTAYGLAE